MAAQIKIGNFHIPNRSDFSFQGDGKVTVIIQVTEYEYTDDNIDISVCPHINGGWVIINWETNEIIAPDGSIYKVGSDVQVSFYYGVTLSIDDKFKFASEDDAFEFLEGELR